jgi:hypothetical protein
VVLRVRRHPHFGSGRLDGFEAEGLRAGGGAGTFAGAPSSHGLQCDGTWSTPLSLGDRRAPVGSEVA